MKPSLAGAHTGSGSSTNPTTPTFAADWAVVWCRMLQHTSDAAADVGVLLQ
jgi:hypothetical protein